MGKSEIIALIDTNINSITCVCVIKALIFFSFLTQISSPINANLIMQMSMYTHVYICNRPQMLIIGRWDKSWGGEQASYKVVQLHSTFEISKKSAAV